MPKGAKEQLKAVAAEHGLSMTRYILQCVERDSGLKLTLGNALPWMQNTEKKN